MARTVRRVPGVGPCGSECRPQIPSIVAGIFRSGAGAQRRATSPAREEPVGWLVDSVQEVSCLLGLALHLSFHAQSRRERTLTSPFSR